MMSAFGKVRDKSQSNNDNNSVKNSDGLCLRNVGNLETQTVSLNTAVFKWPVASENSANTLVLSEQWPK